MFQRFQLVKCVCVPIPDHVVPKLDHPVVLDSGVYYPPNPSINNLVNLYMCIKLGISLIYMDIDLSEHLDLHIPGYEYLWNCAICLKSAISGVILSFQWIEFFHDSVFFI